ncbi:uncharacterized protein LOC124163245 isoform X2 [Ischnura elegans]|uniref:uncharacterized protein LOC124163245 isoform X2 n=1 Tax=Ischnura elegans TaxID=197161 RepID=UPI001ED86A54|nr:uncharacterized protein LOC124163245 isoform X2 [Ischnura elegans]
MHRMNTFESDEQKERSFVLLRILPQTQSVSSTLTCSPDVSQTIISLNEFPSFTQRVNNPGRPTQPLTEKDKVILGTSEKFLAIDHGSSNPGIIRIPQKGPSSKVNLSKVEGRKAPGSNRILPLITSVWEDADLKKKQKSSKGSKKEIKGKGISSTKKTGLGDVGLEEVSDEEYWFESEEREFCGGDLHTAYFNFFMAKEGGEDREDCICGDCGAEFLTATEVAHHLRDEHHQIGVKLFQCFVCRRKRYPALDQLNHHLSNAHGIPRPELTCRTCFMELAGESEAKAHSRKHETPYTCARCSWYLPHSSVPRFSTKFLLAEHLREVHLPKERPYPCSKCGRQFAHQFMCDLHILRRHQGTVSMCPEIRLVGSMVTSAQNSGTESGRVDKSQSAEATGENLSAIDDVEGVNFGLSGKETRPSSSAQKNSSLSSSTKDKNSPQFCSRGNSLFPNEVSLLNHVFHCHDRTLQIQLLKWAREVDREDTFFEQLWKTYSKVSCKGDVDVVNDAVEADSSQNLPSHQPSAETQSPVIESSNLGTSNNGVVNVDRGNCDGFAECSPFLLPTDLSGTATISISKTKLSNDGFTKVSLTSTPCLSDNLSSNASSLSVAPGQLSVDVVPSDSLVENVDPSSAPCEESPKLITVDVDPKDVSGVEIDGESVPSLQITRTDEEIVSECVADILYTVCEVLDKRCVLKQSKKVAFCGEPQKKTASVRCMLCRYLASTPMALERHRRRRHFRNKHCPFCTLACASVDSVWKHVVEVHLCSSTESNHGDSTSTADIDIPAQGQIQKPSLFSSGLRCPVCRKVFPTRGKCNSHQESVHKLEVVSRPLSCEICSKKFLFQKALERHQLLHRRSEGNGSAGGALKCPHCDQTFLRPGFRDRHIASHFENPQKDANIEDNREMGHSCPSCFRRLDTLAKLKEHLRTSHPPTHLKQRFVCSQCPVRCSTASGLRVHMRVHTGERPFPCQQCNATFKRQTALKKHEAALHPTTSGENGIKESFKCPDCDSSFRDRSNLVRHFLQVHRGLRRFVCGLCGNRYGQNQDLRRHLKINHDMEAPKIIGADRRSVDQIYVVPPVLESLPANDPLANKIKLIVEEEEQKFREDNLPQFIASTEFTTSPQQLHLRIHKDGERNMAVLIEEDEDDPGEGSTNTLGDNKNERSMNDKWHAYLVTRSSSDEGNGPEGLKAEKENNGLLLYRAKSSHEKFESGNSSKAYGESHHTSRRKSTGGRNLILDALISSEIALDASEGFVLQTEGEAYGQNFAGSSAELAMGNEYGFILPKEVNIIMSQSPIVSNPQSTVDNSTSKDEESVVMKSKVRKSRRKKGESGEGGSTSAVNFTCEKCGREFLDSSRLERHRKIHNDIKPFTCSVCGRGFLEKFNLKVHMRSHTGERPYKCDECGKTMRYFKEVTDHRRMHKGERPYECEVCSKSFLRSRELQRHLLTHTNEKRYACPICGKAFARLDHLRSAHMPVHKRGRHVNTRVPKRHPDSVQAGQNNNSDQLELNEKVINKKKEVPESEWYSCKKCTKKFSSKAKLNQHLVLHSGQKEHKCTICGRSFALLSYLRLHLKIHRKQEGYMQCPKCPRKFASVETLSVHEEKFHRRIERMRKFPTSETKAGRSKDDDLGDEEKFFMTRHGDFDISLDLEDDMQEVAFFDPASISETERQSNIVHLHVVSDDLQINSETD